MRKDSRILHYRFTFKNTQKQLTLKTTDYRQLASKYMFSGRQFDEVQFKLLFSIDCMDKGFMAIQQSRHKLVYVSSSTISVNFLQMDYLKTFIKKLSELHDLALLQRVCDVTLAQENQILILCQIDDRPALVKLLLNDLMYEPKQNICIKYLDFEPDRILQFEISDNVYVILIGHNQFRTYHVLPKEIVLLEAHNVQFKHGKNIADIVDTGKKKFCCCMKVLRFVGAEWTQDFCPYCGKQLETVGQHLNLDGVKVEIL